MFILLLLLLLLISSSHSFSTSYTPLSMNTTGCGTSKVCFMRPNGCHPERDCTQGYMLSVVGDNQLKVEMFAASLEPAVSLQYMSIAFSDDKQMGDDVVTECVISESGIEAAEVFLSHNVGKSNDRVHIEDMEKDLIFADIESSHADGRIMCSFILSIRPQLSMSRGGKIIDLDKEFFIFGATGSCQPDEVNPHDLNRESFFFPIIYQTKVNPSQIGNTSHQLPLSTLGNAPTKAAPPPPPRRLTVGASSSSIFTLSTMICYLIYTLL